MSGPAIALTLMLLQAGGSGARASAKDTSGTRASKPAPVRERVLSCVGGQIYFLDGHYYRLVRGAWVECSPDLPPAV